MPSSIENLNDLTRELPAYSPLYIEEERALRVRVLARCYLLSAW